MNMRKKLRKLMHIGNLLTRKLLWKWSMKMSIILRCTKNNKQNCLNNWEQTFFCSIYLTQDGTSTHKFMVMPKKHKNWCKCIPSKKIMNNSTQEKYTMVLLRIKNNFNKKSRINKWSLHNWWKGIPNFKSNGRMYNLNKSTSNKKS